MARVDTLRINLKTALKMGCFSIIIVILIYVRSFIDNFIVIAVKKLLSLREATRRSNLIPQYNIEDDNNNVTTR